MMKRYGMWLCRAGFILSFLVAVWSGIWMISYYAELDEQLASFQELAEEVEAAETVDETGGEAGSLSSAAGEDGILAKYYGLYLQNEDMVGWISIPGTTIDYPVMQTVDDANYYLKRGFDREYSALGVPYVQENCRIGESDNLIIYGHHIRGRRMFGALESYRSESFFEEHPQIEFDTLTEEAQYQIIAVFKTVAYSSQGFRYYDFVDAEDEEEFDAYVAECKRLSFYDTGETASYGDHLITLSTCEYTATNGRLVVVARKII